MSYGGNFRFSNFDLSIAPAADSRKEGGGYLQDEIFLGKYVRLLVGARVDKFDIIEDVQFSPRTTLMLKPTPDQTIRVSYNRAYRAPSVINNFLDTTIINQLPLGSINPAFGSAVFNFPVRAVGSNIGLPQAGIPPQDLVEQSITAYEIGYTGVIKQRATVSAAFFFNETKDDIFFTQVASYRATNPPPRLAAVRRFRRSSAGSSSRDSSARRAPRRLRSAPVSRSAWATACRRRSATATSARWSRRASSWASTAPSRRSGAGLPTTRTSPIRRRSAFRSPRSTCRPTTASTSA